MTAGEMHIMFRAITQQMGMQTVRAVLDEDIDICLNMAVNAAIKKVLASDISYAGDEKILRDNAKIGQLNAFRSLYNRIRLSVIEKDLINNCYTSNLEADQILLITGVNVSYKELKGRYDARITDLDFLHRSINDFCNSPSFDSPIVIALGNKIIKLDIYNSSSGIGKELKDIEVIAILKPAIIKYSEAEDNVDCDLPDYMHDDIVKAAANIWLESVGVTSN